MFGLSNIFLPAVFLGGFMAVWIVQETRRSPSGRFVPGNPTLAEVAWTQGGRSRVTDTWLAELVDGGWLTLDDDKEYVYRVKQTGQPGLPFDEERASAVNALPVGVAMIRQDLEEHWSALQDDIQLRLEHAGLLSRRREHRSHVVQAQGIFALFVFALLWWRFGIFFFSEVALGYGIVAIILGANWKPDRLTMAGGMHREHWQEKLAHFATNPKNGSLGETVAMGGLQALKDTPFRDLANLSGMEEEGWEVPGESTYVSWARPWPF